MENYFAHCVKTFLDNAQEQYVTLASNPCQEKTIQETYPSKAENHEGNAKTFILPSK